MQSEIAFTVRIMRGRLYLNRVRVRALVDHDRREIQVSNLVPRRDRRRLVAVARCVAAQDGNNPGPFAHVYTRGLLAEGSGRHAK